MRHQEAYKEWDVWKSHTCYVCSGGTGIPSYHAARRGYVASSPCDTVVRVVRALSRGDALQAIAQDMDTLYQDHGAAKRVRALLAKVEGKGECGPNGGKR